VQRGDAAALAAALAADGALTAAFSVGAEVAVKKMRPPCLPFAKKLLLGTKVSTLACFAVVFCWLFYF
jgi:hypothetical protein